MRSKTLYCTECENAVRFALDWDGYYGSCGCGLKRFYPGLDGDRPNSWLKWEDADG
jgi:hypothetical protein